MVVKVALGGARGPWPAQPACSWSPAIVTPHTQDARRYFLFLMSSFLSSPGTNEKTE